MSRQLVLVGLGNPGRRYDGTRHNVGFRTVDAFAVRHGATFTQQSRALVRADCRLADVDIILVKPQRYMNRSGGALVNLRQVHEFDLEDLLVVTDDIALPLGRLRLRRGGSDGGHNGLRSIIEALGSNAFSRLRLGVGGPPDAVDAADYVLERFEEEDREAADEMVGRAVACIESVLEDGFERAMGHFNTRPAPESD